MQQLSLFNSDPAFTSLGLAVKRRSKKGKMGSPQYRGRDLWSLDTEPERELALFFLDIRNFTSLAERHPASDLIHIIKKLFSTFQKIIRIHRGQIIEIGGDGFYAAFGFDRDATEAVNSAVAAGIVILNTLDQLNTRSFEKNLHHRIEIGIGVHVGRVATGNLHLGSRDHFVVMGFPVNIASRLQTATKELNNNFVVSAEAYRLLKEPPQQSKAVSINLKGIAAPWDVHLVGRAYVAA